MVAAATTSLPETREETQLGYRTAGPRLHVRPLGLYALGFDWKQRFFWFSPTWRKGGRASVMYGVDGERDLSEQCGASARLRRGSPVRVGNAHAPTARTICGAPCSTPSISHEVPGSPGERIWPVLTRQASVRSSMREPTGDGEVRGEPKHFTPPRDVLGQLPGRRLARVGRTPSWRPMAAAADEITPTCAPTPSTGGVSPSTTKPCAGASVLSWSC